MTRLDFHSIYFYFKSFSFLLQPERQIEIQWSRQDLFLCPVIAVVMISNSLRSSPSCGSNCSYSPSIHWVVVRCKGYCRGSEGSSTALKRQRFSSFMLWVHFSKYSGITVDAQQRSNFHNRNGRYWSYFASTDLLKTRSREWTRSSASQ